jgi:hypothetical protein
MPTPGSFEGLENREEVIAKPLTYFELKPGGSRLPMPNGRMP